MIKLGVIGCGVIGRHHVKAIHAIADAEVVMVCDLRAEVAQAVQKEFSVSRWTDKVEEVLADDSIAGVVIALPTGVRAKIALQALAAGKHILLEKPVTMNMDEWQKLDAAKNGLIVACASSRNRTLESARIATEFIREGHLGKIRSISCRVITQPSAPPVKAPPVWRLNRELNGGGILMNWGCYDFDYLFGLLDLQTEPAHVLAHTWEAAPGFSQYVAPGSNAETHGMALITFKNGIVLQYERAEFSSIPRHAHWEITGENGTLSLVMSSADESHVTFVSPHQETGVHSRVLYKANESEVNMIINVNKNFVASIAGTEKPWTDLDRAKLTVQVTDAIYESAATGRPVSFGVQ